MQYQYVAILRINGTAGTARETVREDVGGILESLQTMIKELDMKLLVHFVEGDCEEFPPTEEGATVISPYFELVSPEEGLEQTPGREVENHVERRGTLIHKIAEHLTSLTGLPVFMSVYREILPYDPEQEPEELA